MYAQRLAYDPYRGRDLTPEEAETAAANPLIWRWIEWREVAS